MILDKKQEREGRNKSEAKGAQDFQAQKLADVAWLFETNAVRVAPADNPFWFTSGLISPYYISTHYLCGGEKHAEEVLQWIEREQVEYQTFPPKMLAVLEDLYVEHSIYRQVTDALVQLAKEAVDLSSIRYITGGQRRDWFFSPLLAKLLHKPCLYVYNDLSIFDEDGAAADNLDSGAVLHVADLLTVASSYTTKWIPALERFGLRIDTSLNCVDRKQGGAENLEQAGVRQTVSLFSIEPYLFERALAEGVIESSQYDVLMQYYQNPFDSMRTFLMQHPEFITKALKSSDERTRIRAELLVKEDLYNLKEK